MSNTTTENTVTITAYHQPFPGAKGYEALSAGGKGRKIAVIAGPVEVAPIYGEIDGGRMLDDGQVYALRDVLEFARRGERGLRIVG